MMHRFRCISFKPPNSPFPPKLLLDFDPDLKHGKGDVDNVHEFCSQFDGFASILAVPAAEIQNCQACAVADCFRHEFVFEFGEKEAIV